MASSHHRAAKHAALPLAACAVAALGAFATPSASAQALQAQRIVIDKDTGRARMPEHDELAAAAAAAPAARAAARTSAKADTSARAVLQSHPAAHLLQSQPLAAQLGAHGRRVDASRLSFTVIQRGSDGKVSSQCIVSESAAVHALHGTAVGGHHDH